MKTVYSGGPVFDGSALRVGMAVVVADGRVAAVVPDHTVETTVDLGGDIIAPGFVDLQANGGGGVMLNDDPCPAVLARIAGAHRRLGTASILPTLITSSPETAHAAVAAVGEATATGMPGIAGLHLEGPHLSVVRKGAHDPALIRPMEADDLEALCAAARILPALMVTVAPEAVTEEQVRTLADAGAVVSLGHTNADFETCRAYARAGARCATHLFNAMGGITGRAPGLAGTAIFEGGLSAGLIADGIHVHPAVIGPAVRGKTGPGKVFLVTDAMAVAGTDLAAFRLDGREIRRDTGRLTLADGTLAGADLDLLRAVRLLVGECGIGLTRALAMATSDPASVAGLPEGSGRIAPGAEARLVRIRADLSALTPLWPGD